MELDKRSLEGIALCNNETSLSDKDFEKLSSLAYAVASHRIDKDGEASIFESIKGDKLMLKQAYAGLITFALEASRHNASLQDMSSVLDERLSSDRLALLSSTHTQYKDNVREVLSRSSVTFANIVDIQWRLDYFVQSNLLDNHRSLLYFISITTREPDGSLTPFEFYATLEDLQDLLARCRDALNAVQNINI